MDTYKEFHLPDEKAIRNKPVTIDLNDEYLFKHEYKKNLSAVSPIIRKKTYLSLIKRMKFNSVKEYKDKEFPDKKKNPDSYFYKNRKKWFDYLSIDTSKWIKDK